MNETLPEESDAATGEEDQAQNTQARCAPSTLALDASAVRRSAPSSASDVFVSDLDRVTHP
jgi:hypothetical protein